MARRDDVTVDEVQEAIDSIVFATRYKTEDSPNPSDNSHLFLDSFLSLGILFLLSLCFSNAFYY